VKGLTQASVCSLSDTCPILRTNCMVIKNCLTPVWSLSGIL